MISIFRNHSCLRLLCSLHSRQITKYYKRYTTLCHNHSIVLAAYSVRYCDFSRMKTYKLHLLEAEYNKV